MRTGWPERLLIVAALLCSRTAFAGEPKQAVLDVPGVLEAKADFAGKRAEVKYDPDKVTPRQLAGAVTNAGYPATVKPH